MDSVSEGRKIEQSHLSKQAKIGLHYNGLGLGVPTICLAVTTLNQSYFPALQKASIICIFAR